MNIMTRMLFVYILKYFYYDIFVTVFPIGTFHRALSKGCPVRLSRIKSDKNLIL